METIFHLFPQCCGGLLSLMAAYVCIAIAVEGVAAGPARLLSINVAESPSEVDGSSAYAQ